MTANPHVPKLKIIIPETVSTASLVSAVEVSPLFEPTLTTSKRSIAQIIANDENASDIIEMTVGTTVGLFSC